MIDATTYRSPARFRFRLCVAALQKAAPEKVMAAMIDKAQKMCFRN
jgi:hypothetical protein